MRHLNLVAMAVEVVDRLMTELAERVLQRLGEVVVEEGLLSSALQVHGVEVVVACQLLLRWALGKKCRAVVEAAARLTGREAEADPRECADL